MLIYKILNLLVYLSISGRAHGAALGCEAQLTLGTATSNVEPFSSRGRYVHDYDLILFLPFYLKAMNLHARWVRDIQAANPIVIDAGGGTGNMTLAAQNVRADTEVHLLDMNEEMTKFARQKGVPEARIHLSNILQMQMNGKSVGAQTVDHVFSHSVIWSLERPQDFFKEAARVLKKEGTLAISTVRPINPSELEHFLSYLDQHLFTAELAGHVARAQRENFVEQNRKLLSILRSPLTAGQLTTLAHAAGFELLESHDAYVVPTPTGARAIFSQVLFKKL